MTGEGWEAPASLPDLVYIVRSGENEELRYSLRSIDKFADGLFRNVWVVGTGLPAWLHGVNVLPVKDLGAIDGRSKHVNMRRKIRAACDVSEISDHFLLLNDDYFLTKPIKEWVVYHMGPASEWLDKKITQLNGWSSYLRDVHKTVEWMQMQGYGDVLVRETHSPTWWVKSRLAEVLDEYPESRPVTVVDLYDAAGIGQIGEYALNAKIHNDEQLEAKLFADDSPWLSSSDFSFEHSKVGSRIRDLFPEPSRFEV